MKRTAKILALAMLISIFGSFTAMADGNNKDKRAEREQWLREMRTFKHEFFQKELDLKPEQATKFFALYDAMDDELRQARHSVRHAEHQLKKKGKSATEADYEQVANMQIELRGKENAIEMRYYKQFKEVLSGPQLVKLKEVERKFDKFIREQHDKCKKGKDKK